MVTNTQKPLSARVEKRSELINFMDCSTQTVSTADMSSLDLNDEETMQLLIKHDMHCSR